MESEFLIGIEVQLKINKRGHRKVMNREAAENARKETGTATQHFLVSEHAFIKDDFAGNTFD